MKIIKKLNGKWLNEEPYGVVHRVASTGIVRGAASFCLDWAYAQTLNLRMDTYSDNIPMQKLLGKMLSGGCRRDCSRIRKSISE